MAKKIFCDVCGDEMTYEQVPPHLKGQDVPVRVKGHEGDLENVGNGEHVDVDVCGDCRAFLLDKLDTRPKPAEGLYINPGVLAFLKGEGQLNGADFGEKPKGERGEFWWRRFLP